MITVATFALLCLPLIAQAFRLALSGRYVSQTYFWRSAPRGVDALAPFARKSVSSAVRRRRERALCAVSVSIASRRWAGSASCPIVVLLMGRGHVVRRRRGAPVEGRARRVCDLGARAVSDGRGVRHGAAAAAGARAIRAARRERADARPRDGVRVSRARCVDGAATGGIGWPKGQHYDRCADRRSADRRSADRSDVVPTFRSAFGRPAVQWALLLLLALDYLHAPIPLTALDRPAVYEQLATISDNGAVIEVPFGIGDGLSTGRGSQDRRLLYNATIHGHPVVGGYIGRMPPNVAQAYDAMPVVGNLLRLSNGEEAIEEEAPTSLPFRYLVLDTNTASPELRRLRAADARHGSDLRRATAGSCMPCRARGPRTSERRDNHREADARRRRARAIPIAASTAVPTTCRFRWRSTGSARPTRRRRRPPTPSPRIRPCRSRRACACPTGTDAAKTRAARRPAAAPPGSS